MHAGGRHLNVLAISQETAKKTFRNGTATNITCTNEEDTFHQRPPRDRAGSVRYVHTKVRQRDSPYLNGNESGMEKTALPARVRRSAASGEDRAAFSADHRRRVGKNLWRHRLPDRYPRPEYCPGQSRLRLPREIFHLRKEPHHSRILSAFCPNHAGSDVEPAAYPGKFPPLHRV